MLSRLVALSIRFRGIVVALACLVVGYGIYSAWTARYTSVWPDLIIGLGIALINAGSAREVWEAARNEHRSATA